MHQPKIKTSPPGPNAKKLIEADSAVVSPSLIKEYPLVVEKAQGIMIEDVDGNQFLDFMSGIAVTLTGHCHPSVVQAIKDQADKLLHICGTDFYYQPYTRLCQKLVSLAPDNSDWQVYLGNSGAEAVEAALKLARNHSNRPYFIAFHGSFHGRTYGALSLTASKVTQRAGFSPLLPGIVHQPYGNCYRCVYNLSYPDCDIFCIENWRETLFKTTIPPQEVSAIVVEPIQGEGGHIVPPPEYFPRLRKLCDDYGILLIADEVQSGMGRTGKFFAMEHWNITPDILLLSKGLGSGMPISALLAKKETMTWQGGSHGSTLGGNPVCCAAALATIDLIVPDLMNNAKEMGKYLKSKLINLQENYQIIGVVRGIGLMLAIEFVSDCETKTKAPQLAEQFGNFCFEKGLLVLGCGENSVRLAPPLIVSKSEIDTAVDIMEKVLREIK